MNIRISLILVTLLMLSCGPKPVIESGSGNDYKNNFQVKKFFKEFNKTEFISAIKEKRKNAEEYITEIKKIEKESENIKNLYTEAQSAYNVVLQKMSSDINAINNILDFSTLNATSKYQTELKDAELKETIFINAATKILYPDEETSLIGDIFNSILSLIPGAKEIQNIYLNRLKSDINSKIDEAKWRNWSDI